LGIRRRFGQSKRRTKPEPGSERMSRLQLTQVEILEQEHRGLQHYVDASFDRGVIGREVARGLYEKYGVTIPVRTLQSYRLKRWRPQRDQIQKSIKDLNLVFRIMEEHPEYDVRAALIFKALFQMAPSELTQRDFEMKRVDAQNRKLDIEDKRVKNQANALHAKLKEAKTARKREKAKRPATRAKDEDELRKKIDEIYGIGTAGPGPAPVSGKVDR